MDKKPASQTTTGGSAEPAAESVAASPPKALPMPAYSPVGAKVPPMAVAMPHTGAGGTPATPKAAMAVGAKGAPSASVMRMEGYPHGCGGMQARAMVATQLAVPAHVVTVAPIGGKPRATGTAGDR